jgi:hypothetical protein
MIMMACNILQIKQSRVRNDDENKKKSDGIKFVKDFGRYLI